MIKYKEFIEYKIQNLIRTNQFDFVDKIQKSFYADAQPEKE